MKLIRFSLVFTLICLAGFGGTSWYISVHTSPENITAGGKEYSIVRGNGSEYGFFYVFSGNKDTVHSFYGSTDLLCTGPSLYWWDVDCDGENELYCETCGGNSYLDFTEGEPPVVVEAGEGRTLPGLDSWFFRDLSNDFGGYLAWGSFFLLLGAMLAFLLLLVAITIYFRKRKKVLRGN